MKWQFYHAADLGMATGRVRAEFFNTRTRPAGQDLQPEPGPFTKRIFFSGPRPGPTSPTGPVPHDQSSPKSKTNFFFFLEKIESKNFDLWFFSPKSQTQTQIQT